MLSALAPYLHDFAVDRQYRLQSTPAFCPAIFLQGACESSHGLSDTLLSVTAVRTDEIGEALLSNGNTANQPITRQAGNPIRIVANR
jgi:lysine N6-hydroxylase/L-ornithine N5-oxygenase